MLIHLVVALAMMHAPFQISRPQHSHPLSLFFPSISRQTAVGKDGLVEWMDVDDYKFQMEVNLYGFIRVTKAFLPLLKVGDCV